MLFYRRILGFSDGDLLLAALLLLAGLFDPARTGADVTALVVVGAVAVAGRSRWPGPVALICCGAFGALLALGHLVPAACLPALVGLYTAAVRNHRLWALAALVVVVGCASLWPAPDHQVRAVFTATWLCLLGAAILVGEVVRARRELVIAHSRNRAVEERLWLARELHDVVGHSMSGIAVQSASALHLLGEEHTEVRAALQTIRASSKATLRELQTTLGLLHGESPGLDRLDALLEAVRQAGLTVRISYEGEPVYLPAQVSHAAYRIVQESLTNVLRHAEQSATAVVTLAYSRSDLSIDISNDGTVHDGETAEGRGIAGMRARAEAMGGSLTATASPEGGFRVSALLLVTSPGAAAP